MTTAAASCVFCRIVAGELPARVVWRSGRLLAFLDINPLAEGHILVVPTTHYAHLDGLPADLASEIGAGLPRLAAAVREVTGCPAYNVLQNNGEAAGQVVQHVHFHLVPRRDGDGLGYRWNAGKYPPGRIEEIEDAFRRVLQAEST